MHNLEVWFGGLQSEGFNFYEFKSAGLIEKCEKRLDLENESQLLLKTKWVMKAYVCIVGRRTLRMHTDL